MPVPGPLVYQSFVTADTTVTTTTETVVATLSNMNLPVDLGRVELIGWINFLTGTATTIVTLRWRQDSLTGTLIGEFVANQIIGAVGNTQVYAINEQFVPSADMAGKTIVLTIQQTAATGNGTVSTAHAMAIVHN